MSKVRPKEQLFVEEYLKDRNGSRAARAAGYAARSAAVTASRLLRKDNIQAAITTAQAALRDRARAEQDEIAEMLMQRVRGDLQHYVGADGGIVFNENSPNPKAVKSLTTRRYIKAAKDDKEPDEIEVSRIELYDGRAAGADLCKMFGLNEPEEHNLNLNGSIGFRIVGSDGQEREIGGAGTKLGVKPV